jgi:branched-chain amino acid transport system substrate-binding protein
MNVTIKEINRAGGLLGRPVELVVKDHQMKPEIAVQQLRKMIMSDKCEAIFEGGGRTAVALAIHQAIPLYKKIFIPMDPWGMGLTGKYFNPYSFRTDTNIAITLKAMALFIGEQKKEFRKGYMINMDDSAGRDAADYYQKFIKEIAPDTQIVGNDFHPTIFIKDFGLYISKIKASGADYLVTGISGTDNLQLVQQARSFGLKIPMFGTATADLSVLSALQGDEAVGNFGVCSYVLGFDTPEAKKFEESFRQKLGGKWPEEQIWYTYKSVMMYAEAVKNAGSLDTDKVIKAFERMKWNGPTGIVTMRAKDHQAFSPMIVYQVVKKTKYYDFPYVKPIQIIPPEQLNYNPEEFGWKPYMEEK